MTAATTAAGPPVAPEGAENTSLVQKIQTYYQEAVEARETNIDGDARDDVWEANWRAFWSSFDYSEKADWQAKHKLSTVSNNVQRFVASMRKAISEAEPFYSVRDRQDPTQVLSPLIEAGLQVFLDRCGTNASGQPIGFEAMFGQIVRSGAMMAMCCEVVWKGGRVQTLPVDPRTVYFDPTGRGMYRLREIEMDWHDLDALADKRDAKGQPIYDAEAIEYLMAQHEYDQNAVRKEASAGHGRQVSAKDRKPVTVLQFLGKLVDEDGELLDGGRLQLVEIANDKVLIRGPERNPYAHGRDWIVFHALLPVPFSVYGQSYVELFSALAEAFVDLTNLLLDAATAEALNQHEITPDYLEDASQANDGFKPGKTWVRSETAMPGEPAVRTFQAGQVGSGAVAIWNGLKQEIREESSRNELSLGQLTKGETTATEVMDARDGSQSLDASIAMDIEDFFLTVVLELVWLTAVQHLTDNVDQTVDGEVVTDAELLSELNPELVQAIVQRRDEFLTRKLRFKVRGITGVLQKQKRLRALLSALQVIGSNEALIAAYQRRYSLDRLVDVLLRDLGVDLGRLEKTQQERMQEAMAARAGAQAAGANGGGAPGNGTLPSDPMASVMPGGPPEGMG